MAGILPFISKAIGSLLSNNPVTSLVSTFLTNKSNEKLMYQQQEYNERMLDKQNEYNSPVEQMKRMKEAGLNPAALGMGENGVQVGGQSAAPLPTNLIPKQDYLSALSNSFLQNQQALSTKSKRQAEIDNIEAQTKQLLANTELIGLNAESQRIVNGYVAAQQEWSLAETKSRVSLNYAQRAQLKQSIKNMRYELENVLPEEVKKTMSETRLNVLSLEEVTSRIMSIKADTRLKEEQTLTEIEKQGALQAEASKTWQEDEQIRAYLDKFTEMYGVQIRKLAADAHISEKEAQWYVFDEIVKGVGTVGFVASQFTPVGKFGSGLGKAVTKGTLSTGKPLSDSWY